ncbi:septum formation initiator family protein [Borrelia venezuelensis]|uniref:septum formation initiator family protein n=1 Tax=Borrelia venezuelensis TaxID=1653839 RepID=UPI001FF2D798|nr:septum formation initiator family protein [Borrelia venezuelensis]UPA12389.1 septum formation initiator family protein [Borrelia venezuelensis]
MSLTKKIMLSIYTGVISYFMITPIFGETGIINYNKLNSNLILMKNHTEKLKEIQKNLTTKYINLQISKPTILKEASKLGYYPKNSIIIKNLDEDENYHQGNFLNIKHTSENKNIGKNFYLISIVISLIFYFLLSYLDKIKFLNKIR